MGVNCSQSVPVYVTQQKHTKNEANIRHLVRTSLVNKGFITWRKKRTFTCGTNAGNPERASRVAKQNAGFASSCLLADSAINKTPKVVSVGCVGLWKHNGVLSEFGKLIRETGKMCHVMSIDE